MTFRVIIPAFNAADTIERALQSCMSQSFSPIEIIVVDDASEDETYRIVANFAPVVRLIRLPENKGVAYARNAGWNEATGDYIAFLDSDDEWHPDKLKIIAAYFDQRPEVKLIYHPYTLTELGSFLHWQNQKLTQYPFWKLLFTNPLQTSCICVAGTINMRFNEHFRYCEDHEFVLRIAARYGCYQLPLKLTRLDKPQMLGKGLSGNIWKMRKGEMKMYLNLWRINPLITPLIPFFLLGSIMKHIWRWLSIKSGWEHHRKKNKS